jgi:hypothetical protein
VEITGKFMLLIMSFVMALRLLGYFHICVLVIEKGEPSNGRPDQDRTAARRRADASDHRRV